MFFYFKRRKINKYLKKIKTFQSGRKNEDPSSGALKKELKLYKKLIRLYLKLIGNKREPHARLKSIECYRAAAGLEDKDACFQLGRYMLDEASCRQELEDEGIFSHPANQKLKDNAFEQAHVYLEAATRLNHIEAMRLLGLCYIHGWGKPRDKDKGFDMVVDSIEKEGAWDKLPDIFARLGLNRPDLIFELMQRRKQ